MEEDEIDPQDAHIALNLIQKIKPFIMWMPHKEIIVVHIETVLASLVKENGIELDYTAGNGQSDHHEDKLQEEGKSDSHIHIENILINF